MGMKAAGTVPFLEDLEFMVVVVVGNSGKVMGGFVQGWF